MEPCHQHSPNPWSDGSDRHAFDAYLRTQGFRILARPNGKPAVWGRHGSAYTVDEALALCPKEQVQDAAMLEDFYLGQRCR